MVKWFYQQGDVLRGSAPIEKAALNKHFELIQSLHSKGIECSTAAMDNAAQSNRLDIVQWLHQNRSEGCTTAAMDVAAGHGYLESSSGFTKIEPNDAREVL